MKKSARDIKTANIRHITIEITRYLGGWFYRVSKSIMWPQVRSVRLHRDIAGIVRDGTDTVKDRTAVVLSSAD